MIYKSEILSTCKVFSCNVSLDHLGKLAWVNCKLTDSLRARKFMTFLCILHFNLNMTTMPSVTPQVHKQRNTAFTHLAYVVSLLHSWPISVTDPSKIWDVKENMVTQLAKDRKQNLPQTCRLYPSSLRIVLERVMQWSTSSQGSYWKQPSLDFPVGFPTEIMDTIQPSHSWSAPKFSAGQLSLKIVLWFFLYNILKHMSIVQELWDHNAK